VKAPLDGTAPSTVVDVPSYCSLSVIGSALYCTNVDGAAQIAPVTTPLAPFPTKLFLVPLGDGLVVSLEKDKVVALNADGSVMRVLWQRPAGFEAEFVYGAARDGNSPCTTVGQNKLSQTVCDKTRARFEIVRASVN
jgi:hypothetical protein